MAIVDRGGYRRLSVVIGGHCNRAPLVLADRAGVIATPPAIQRTQPRPDVGQPDAVRVPGRLLRVQNVLALMNAANASVRSSMPPPKHTWGGWS